MIWFILFLIIATVVVLLLRKYTSLEFVAHAKKLFKAWSVWLTGVGTLLSAYFLSAPDAMITVWTMLPADLKAMLPVNVAQWISYGIIAMGILAQFIRQKKLTSEVKNV